MPGIVNGTTASVERLLRITRTGKVFEMRFVPTLVHGIADYNVEQIVSACCLELERSGEGSFRRMIITALLFKEIRKAALVLRAFL